jgi:protein Mpv17
MLSAGGARFLATKVVLDSAIMGSVYVIAFFAFIATALERTGLEGFKQKMKVRQMTLFSRL